MKIRDVAKKLVVLVLSAMLGTIFVACSAYPPGYHGGYYDNYQPGTGDEFTEFSENQFFNVEDEAVSYFSMDVSTASYSVIRKYINNGLALNKDMVKIEEMINYFKYSYAEPEQGNPLSINGSIFPCPWNSSSQLLSVGLKAKDIEFESIRNNLVFLIDTSGSMDAPDKLGLLQEAFSILADNLNDNDVVSIVTYAGSSSTVLDGAAGAERLRIKNIISDMTAGGSTGGQGGIERAYQVAQKHYIEGGNNRVILATDGDFNVGISSQSKLERFITDKRNAQKGVYLSVMGFGLGNLKSNTMDTLAQNGNGAAYYIDGILEAKRVMASEIKGTLVTVLDDVKASVEFNPSKVEAYRLLGYETKLLSHEDWENNQKDAGEIGAGHCVTALYEIKLKDNNTASEYKDFSNAIVKVAVRYKEPFADEKPSDDNREVKELSRFISSTDILNDADLHENEDLVFIAAVAEAGLVFRNSEFKAEANILKVIERIEKLTSTTTNEFRADFLNLLKKYAR